MSNFLYYMALGDSFGMKYEFVPHTTNATRADLFHGPHPKYAAYVTGRYTDDTQMSVANMELLLTNPAPTEEDFVNAWLDAFRRDPVEGYSKRMQKVLTESKTAADFRAAVDPKNGTTSGAAMRAAPFGLLRDIRDVEHFTRLQARITHDTPAGTETAVAVARAVHFLHYGGARKNLPGIVGSSWQHHGDGETGNAVTIISLAFDAVMKANTLSEVLLNVVNGAEKSDTDTACAVAMVIASRCHDLIDDLPPALHEGLDQSRYGANYLRDLDAQAFKAFPPRPPYKKTAPSPD